MQPELYKTNSNDPQIILWQDAMMKEINLYKSTCFKDILGMGVAQKLVDACLFNIEKLILPNCNSHPNSLLACEDPRWQKYVNQKGIGDPFPKIK